jgi:hypothetical protein
MKLSGWDSTASTHVVSVFRGHGDTPANKDVFDEHDEIAYTTCHSIET